MLPDLSRLGAWALPTAAGECKDNNKGKYCHQLKRDREYHLNEIAALKKRIEELQDKIEDTLRDCEIEQRSKDVAETRAQERDEAQEMVRELREELNELRSKLAADMAAMAESANGGK